MAKCGGCGKFMSASAESIRCPKCPGVFHHSCVGLETTSIVSPDWKCPGCKAKIPKTDNSATPVKGPSEGNKEPNATLIIQAEPLGVAPIVKPADLDIAHEIRCFREELSAMRAELREFRQEMSDLKNDVGSCRERMDLVENKLSDLEKRFEETEPASRDKLEETIADLKIQLNERDQDMLLNDVIITGIPELKDESPIHLLKLVSLKLGVAIDDREIVNAERIGMVRRNFTASGGSGTAESPSRPRALAVRLARRTTRDQLLRAARVRRGLTTADLELHGQPSRFYINERLTPNNGKLFFKAREAGQLHKFKYVWTKDGRIYARKGDGIPAQRIRSDVDIVRIFGDLSV